MKMRIDLTKMILRALRIWLIKTEKIATPDGDIEEWFEREYMERTVYDRLHNNLRLSGKPEDNV
jgi:hypothetical protein